MEAGIIRKAFIPFIVVFILINGFLLMGKPLLEKYDASQSVLIVGHLIIFLLTIVSFIMHTRALSKKSTLGFVNAVYGGMMVKMFGCLIAAFLYIISEKKGVNKAGLFGCMAFYLIYTFIETRITTRLNSMQKNA